MTSNEETQRDPREFSQAALLDQCRATFVRLERWRTAAASYPKPTVGTDLYNDDKIWRWMPPTTLCIASLGNAREHLHAIRRLIEARELFPSATSTLARSGLMSGAIAVWMLAPDDAVERHRRMLTFALEDYRNHISYGTQVSRTFHVDDIESTADEQITRLRERSAEVRALLEPLGGPYGWNLTDTIIPAALRATTADERQRAQFESRWRVTSGAAHGFLWQHAGSPGTSVTEVDPSGVSLSTIGGSVETLVVDYFTAYHVTARGWALFAMRAGRPELGG